MSTFTNLRHKVKPADLVSELFLNLKKSEFTFLPANRRQFYGLADKAMINILRDMQKAAGRKMRPQSGFKTPLLDIHADDNPSQDPLKSLLDTEEMLRIESLLAKLTPREQEVFRQVRNGSSLEEIAEMLECSVSTVKADLGKARSFLKMALLRGSKPDA